MLSTASALAPASKVSATILLVVLTSVQSLPPSPAGTGSAVAVAAGLPGGDAVAPGADATREPGGDERWGGEPAGDEPGVAGTGVAETHAVAVARTSGSAVRARSPRDPAGRRGRPPGLRTFIGALPSWCFHPTGSRPPPAAGIGPGLGGRWAHRGGRRRGPGRRPDSVGRS